MPQNRGSPVEAGSPPIHPYGPFRERPSGRSAPTSPHTSIPDVFEVDFRTPAC